MHPLDYEDLQLQTFSHFNNPGDLIKCEYVCKNWQATINKHQALWVRLTHLLNPEWPPSLTPKIDFKNFCISKIKSEPQYTDLIPGFGPLVRWANPVPYSKDPELNAFLNNIAENHADVPRLACFSAPEEG